MDTLKIIGIVGSLRQDSINKQLANEAAKALGSQADFELLDYSEIPMLNQDCEYPAPETVKQVRGVILGADGIWFFSPEYNHYPPGCLKNLIDWLSRPISKTEPQVLSGKPAAVSGITPGISGTGIAQDHLITLISFLNMKVMNQPRLVIPNAMQQIDKDGRLALEYSAPFLEKQAQAFIQFILNNKQ